MKKSVAYSILLHAMGFIFVLVSGQLSLFKNQAPTSTTEPRSIQVRTLSQNEIPSLKSRTTLTPKNQIVQNDKSLKASETPPPPDTRFLSHQNQSVDNPTRARKIGEFKNVANPGGTPRPKNTDFFKLARNPRDLEQEQSQQSKTGRLRAPASLDSSQNSGEGESQTDDHLEDIATSSQTLLNTREFIYYSFYDRIRKTLRNTWNQRLNHEISRLLQTGTSLPLQLSTSVKVHLDPSGQIRDVIIVRASGFESLDRAARLAFFDAAPFPNPPRGLVVDKNEIEIHWDFVVVSEPTGPIRFDVKRSY